MANAQLLDKQYQIPQDVLKYIRTTLMSNQSGNGVKRAKFILKNGSVTYQVLERLKNFFDHFDMQNGDKVQYALAGGDLMRQFIENTLNRDRAGVKMAKEIKRDMTTNPNSELKPYSATPELNEEKKFDIENYDKLKKNAIAVIVNKDNKFLLLKRSDYPDGWQPNKWGLVGGSVEKKEEPEEACEREIKEETGLEIKKFIEKVVIQRNPDSIEHIFACRYDGEDTDIELNEEHSNYGWYDINEVEYLDTVPNLIDYINLVFVKYD